MKQKGNNYHCYHNCHTRQLTFTVNYIKFTIVYNLHLIWSIGACKLQQIIVGAEKVR